MRYRNASTQIALFAGVIAGLIISLHQLGEIDALNIDWSDPVGWFAQASAEDAVGATLRSIALLIGYWIAASAALYAAVSVRRPRRPRAITLFTLPFVRRMLDRTLATALTASIAAAPLAPAVAEEISPPPVVFEVVDGIPVPHVSVSVEVLEVDEPSATDSATAIAPPSAVDPVNRVIEPPVPAISRASTAPPITSVYTGYTVQQGDSLWLIAETHVASALGHRPALETTTTYWRRLVDANRNTLRSGDPNLIFAGEIVTMPSVEVNS